jgi:hypothetical protein
VPRECIGVDENPHRNGGRHPTKSKFPSRDVFSETTALQLKDGSQRKAVRQKEAGTIGKYAASTGVPRAESRCDTPLPLHRRNRPPGWQGPELPLYLEKHPTPDCYKVNAPTRGNAPALGIIEYLAKRENLRAMRRLARIGRQKYALELVAKDRKPDYPPVVPKKRKPPKPEHIYTEAILAHDRAKRADRARPGWMIDRIARMPAPTEQVARRLADARQRAAGPFVSANDFVGTLQAECEPPNGLAGRGGGQWRYTWRIPT